MDETLQNSLSGITSGNPETNTSLAMNPQTLRPVKGGTMPAFQATMKVIADNAYRTRQVGEMKSLSKQFDPTKVSGGTFADIMGYVEQNRGGDISRNYKTAMDSASQYYAEQARLKEQKKQHEYALEEMKKSAKLSLSEKMTMAQYNAQLDMQVAKYKSGLPGGSGSNYGSYKTEAKLKSHVMTASKSTSWADLAQELADEGININTGSTADKVLAFAYDKLDQEKLAQVNIGRSGTRGTNKKYNSWNDVPDDLKATVE